MIKQKKLVVANWKMNPETPREAKVLYLQNKKTAQKLSQVETVVCPPAVFVGFLNHRDSKTLTLGAQDVALERGTGAFTGSISATQVHYAGATYVLVGHSERRAAGDTDEVVNTKVKLALAAGLRVILCIGEKVRDTGGDYLVNIKLQLEADLAGVKRNQFENIVIAYEPVWAIGKEATGVDTPENFLHNALFIRKVISSLAGKEAAHSVRVLYGGSVNVKNALGFLTEGVADGLLVGRASLDLKQFSEILNLAEQTAKVKSKK